MEIITGAERRRRWRVEDKLRIVAEAEAPGSVFALVAARHEISRGQLWKWRTQVRRGDLVLSPMVPEFIPVRVATDEARSVGPAAAGSAETTGIGLAAERRAPIAASNASRIEIVLPDGTSVRIDEGVGASALRRVMAAVRG